MLRRIQLPALAMIFALCLLTFNAGCPGTSPDPGNSNTNTNTNANANDNDNDNDNDNTDPVDNTNTNTNENLNDNNTGPYTLTLNLVGATADTITIDPPAGPYDAGTEVTLTATPPKEYGFAGYTGDIESTEATTTVTIDSDLDVTATFVGDLFVSCFNRDAVLRFDGGTGAYEERQSFSDGLLGPIGLVFRDSTTLLVASRLSDQIFEYAQPGGTFLGIFADDEQFESPRLITFGPNGNLFVTDSNNNDVIEFDGETGAFLGIFTSGGGLAEPRGLAFRANGNLFVANRDTEDVVEFDGETGAYLGAFAVELANPHGIAFTPATEDAPLGNLLVASRDFGYVLEFDGETGDPLGIFAQAPELVEPIELLFGPNGNLFVSDKGTNTIIEFDGQTGDFVRIFADSDEINFPTGMAFRPVP